MPNEDEMRARSSMARRFLAVGMLSLLIAACGETSLSPASSPFDAARHELETGMWDAALTACEAAVAEPGPTGPADPCEARWCTLLARTMMFVDELNDFLIPTFRGAEIGLPSDLTRYAAILQLLDQAAADVDAIAAQQCSFDLTRMPVRIGDAADPIVLAETRGRFTVRSALLIGAIIDSVRYVFLSTINAAPVPTPPPGSNIPGLPTLLERIRTQIHGQDQLFASMEAEPGIPQGGWRDRDGDGEVGAGDELLIDLFEPGSNRRIFDLRDAELATAVSEARGILTSTDDLPAARCGYRQWHERTLFSSADVGTTDGMDFSPDGTEIVLPIKFDGRYEVHRVELATLTTDCLTCSTVDGWDDGVRWHPNGDVLLFVSSRDHRGYVGGAGGGAGQELYAMRSDGSAQTRLTTSPAWATNYHANWSFDGRQIVWGSTTDRTWDVMVADFVDDERGMRLANVRRITHDTSWWETHGFTADGTGIITTNTRAGWQSADLYRIDLRDGTRTRLTDDLAWDEHAHLSPDGRKLSWISARWRPAGMLRLTDGSLQPTWDFFWIIPAILFEFYNPPAGFSTELTLMDADGSAITRLTFDDDVVADNAWSPDASQILFRTTPNDFPREPASIRLLTFDDCAE